ncbi:transposase [Thiolapillus sp.]|uniref:transposase n=1 Tax=Thiolapillus sp. TaxID=2017437 RepID=UPI003AF6F3E1
MDRWCTRVMRSQIEPMKKVAKTIRAHKLLILNWFKAKVTTRNSYGFRTYRGAEIALYHALGNLPTPPMTHRFY